MFLLKRSTGHRFSVQSMIHPKPIWSFHSVENWFHSFFIYVFLINPRSRTWTFHERSETLIHKLRRAVQAMMIHLMLNSRHSACLERIRLRPFKIPYAFSVTTLAPHNLLLKYFCCLSVVFSLYDLMSQKNHEHQQQHLRIVYCS